MLRCFCVLLLQPNICPLGIKGQYLVVWLIYFLHSSFSPFSRHVTFSSVDFVGDLYVPSNYFEEHPFHVLVCKLAPLAMKYTFSLV